MYRTHEMHQLVLEGIPEKYRGEMWMVFSGAVSEVIFDSSHLSSLTLADRQICALVICNHLMLV